MDQDRRPASSLEENRVRWSAPRLTRHGSVRQLVRQATAGTITDATVGFRPPLGPGSGLRRR